MGWHWIGTLQLESLFQLLEDLRDKLSLLESDLFVVHIRKTCRILDQRRFHMWVMPKIHYEENVL